MRRHGHRLCRRRLIERLCLNSWQMSIARHGMREVNRQVLRDFATSIVQTLRREGFHAYLVGGCVRDLLLGREPKDYDVATNATPEQVMDIFPETYAVGAQFGVVLVPAAEKDVASNVSTEGSSKSCAIEVATFR